ncbi:unnamed protein product [Amoebophrya sp. A120]|nr:unnamed protein product [Amoebophrya sp. A120]|eukprot:GSA120T00006722001.1
MGNNGSSSGAPAFGLELRAGVESNLYPWRDMIDYVFQSSKDASEKRLLSREAQLQILEAIDPLVKDLTEGTNVEICDKLGIEGSFQPPTDWCVALLDQIPSLGQARYDIVPRFIEEESFWCRYVNQIFFLIQDEMRIKHGVTFEDDETINIPTALE